MSPSPDDRLPLGVHHVHFAVQPLDIQFAMPAPADPPEWAVEEARSEAAQGATVAELRRAVHARQVLEASEYHNRLWAFLQGRSPGRGSRSDWVGVLRRRAAVTGLYSGAVGVRVQPWLIRRLSIPEPDAILRLHGRLFGRLFESHPPVAEGVRSGRGGGIVFVVELQPTGGIDELLLPPRPARDPLHVPALQNQMRRALLQAGLTLQLAGERMGYPRKSARVCVHGLLTSKEPSITLVDSLAGVCNLSLVELLQLPTDPLPKTRQKKAASRRR